MNSPLTISPFALIGIFGAGLVIGGLIANIKIKARVHFSNLPAHTGSSFVTTKTVRTMELKCACGSHWKFRDSAGAPTPGYEPYPSGDSFSCPKCGKVIDLNEIRKLEADAKV